MSICIAIHLDLRRCNEQFTTGSVVAELRLRVQGQGTYQKLRQTWISTIPRYLFPHLINPNKTHIVGIAVAGSILSIKINRIHRELDEKESFTPSLLLVCRYFWYVPLDTGTRTRVQLGLKNDIVYI